MNEFIEQADAFLSNQDKEPFLRRGSDYSPSFEGKRTESRLSVNWLSTECNS